MLGGTETVNQSDEEMVVFLEFARAAKLEVDLNSVENRRPPEPDIACRVDGRGIVGFELTELIDQDFMARLRLMGRTRQHLAESWQSGLAAGESSGFKSKFGNALLHFVYGEGTTRSQRESITVAVLRMLLRLPENFEGILGGAPEFSTIIREVRVSRGSWNGPVLDADSSGWLGDPTSAALKKKVSKTYQCKYPVELLAYISIDLLPPDDAWMAAIEDLKVRIAESQFQRVWVFDRGSQSVRYEYSVAGSA